MFVPPAFISLTSEEGRVTCVLLLWLRGSWDWLNCLTQFLDLPPLLTLSGCGRDVLGAEGLLCLCFLLSLPSNGPWSSFPAGCCILSFPSYLSYTPRALEWLVEVLMYMHWARWQGKASLVPWKESCLSVCLWVFLRMLEKTLGR